MEALIALVALTLIPVVTSQSCSSFTYTQHPPTPLTCKPYSNGPSPTWQLRTNCAVERDTTNTEAFEIHWIHRDSNGVEEDLGLPSFNSYNPSIPIAQSNGPRLANTAFTEDMVGQYWCQVFLDGVAIPVYSNVITILRPEEYDSQIPVCQSSLLQVVGTMICNDDPPLPVIAATTSSTGTLSTIELGDDHSNGSTTSMQTPASTISANESHLSLTQSPIIKHSTDILIKQSSILVNTVAQQDSSHGYQYTLSLSAMKSVLPSTLSIVESFGTSSTVNSKSTNNTVNFTPTSNTTNVILLNIVYSSTIMIVICASALVIVAVCMKKRIKKAFKKLPIYVDLFQTKHNTDTGIPSMKNSKENILNEQNAKFNKNCCNPNISNGCSGGPHYEALQMNKMDSTTEYSVVLQGGLGHYESRPPFQN